ncbi:MAG TPA: glycosyltransferase family 1 protein [Candidatus Baltobacteraceae bacterium]|jgi:glycosyltransferase involved in cell wall biosynthesis|nr:glycosyltransferase family 1 protein [Candidatus Baltobacteraceae bacterium]
MNEPASSPLRLAIDASNLVADRRGMGRYARGIIHAALGNPGFVTTLLVRKPNEMALPLREEFGREIPIVAESSVTHRGRFDLVWYPFNGMRTVGAIPSVVTIHDAFAFTEPHPSFIGRAREQRPIVRAARHARVIITDSHWSSNEIIRILKPARTPVVIPLQPDPFFFPASEPVPAALIGKRFVLTVGAREVRKNVVTLVHACAASFREGEVLVIVGTPSDAVREALDRTRLPHLLLTPNDHELRALYRNAEIVAVPSSAEGFGLTPAEAMACGAAVIASDASAIPDAVGDAALLVPPFDVEAWSNAIRRVLDDRPLRDRLAASGVARYAVSTRLRAANETLALFREL